MNRSLIVHGPAACGKTRNAVALARHFGLANILDDQDGGRLPTGVTVNTLILTNTNLDGRTHVGTIKCIPYARAVAAAGICRDSIDPIKE